MSSLLMDASVAAAIEAGRSVIVPNAQRAAALRLAWARAQQAQGVTLWATPEILTWDAWLTRQWQQAVLLGRLPQEQQRLGHSQELLLWELALETLPAQETAPDDLQLHAAALMQAAGLATQACLTLAQSAVTEEETLLAEALVRFRRLCQQRQLVSPGIAPLQALSFLGNALPPLIVGQPQLTALQQQLNAQHWPDTALLAPTPVAVEPAAEAGAVCYAVAPDMQQEIAACARWCGQLLQQDGARRLLVVSAYADLSLRTQGTLLWRALGAGSTAETAQHIDDTLLAIEGGEPLLQHALIADALAALALMHEPLETASLSRVLLSPWFASGDNADSVRLDLALREQGLARWSHESLQLALSTLSATHPCAIPVAQWLAALRLLATRTDRLTATTWAELFSQALGQAGFAVSPAMDSHDAQRLGRWSELLDEFAGLDAIVAPMNSSAALSRLQSLAQRATHAAASGDAAITLSRYLGDPVAAYDGIWVLGLAENRWPEPPRPNPYVALSEQRRSAWPEAGVTQRLQQARWAQTCWRARTARLVLSYAAQDGDVHHRPSALLLQDQPHWLDRGANASAHVCLAGAAEIDTQLPPLPPAASPAVRLGQGLERLRLQQQCPFRAQAQIRLGAQPQVTLTDGIGTRLRGSLLHSVLEGVWKDLHDQQTLLESNAAQRTALFERHWQRALHAQQEHGAAFITARVLERERQRAARLVTRVLELDCQRAPFRVLAQEKDALLDTVAGTLRLRIDRVDELAAGERLLIDYKSSEAETIKLDQGMARPLQLAVYVAALAETPHAVQGAALLSLSPAKLGYSGVALDTTGLPKRFKPIADWDATAQQWYAEIAQLVQQHMSGTASITPAKGACRYCHLPSLCRKGGLTDDEDDADIEGDGARDE
jgi:probable DNA repair protein